MRHLPGIFCLSFLLFVLSCVPAAKDFTKLDNELKSPAEPVRINAAKAMGKIKNAEPNVTDALIDCGNNDSSELVRSACVESFFRSVTAEKIKDEKILKTLKDFMRSANCKEQKKLYYIIKNKLPKETREEFESLYGDCIHAYNYCEFCDRPAVGWCTMRYKYVCEQHRYFQQGGRNWRCP